MEVKIEMVISVWRVLRSSQEVEVALLLIIKMDQEVKVRAADLDQMRKEVKVRKSKVVDLEVKVCQVLQKEVEVVLTKSHEVKVKDVQDLIQEEEIEEIEEGIVVVLEDQGQGHVDAVVAVIVEIEGEAIVNEEGEVILGELEEEVDLQEMKDQQVLYRVIIQEFSLVV